MDDVEISELVGRLSVSKRTRDESDVSDRVKRFRETEDQIQAMNRETNHRKRFETWDVALDRAKRRRDMMSDDEIEYREHKSTLTNEEFLGEVLMEERARRAAGGERRPIKPGRRIGLGYLTMDEFFERLNSIENKDVRQQWEMGLIQTHNAKYT